MRLIIMGAPGAGKGTQAGVIAEKLSIPAISTGDIFRANAAGNTPLGLKAKRYMDAGDYVPDEVTNAMVRDRISQADATHGFLLDGYPRTVAQVDELDAMLAEHDHRLDKVLVLAVDLEEIVQRLLTRAVEEDRSDDTEDVIRHRLRVYDEQTAPLISVYAGRGLIVEVDGMGTKEEVTQRLLEALGQTDPATTS